MAGRQDRLHRSLVFLVSFAGGEASDAKVSRAADGCGSGGDAEGFVNFWSPSRSRQAIGSRAGFSTVFFLQKKTTNTNY